MENNKAYLRNIHYVFFIALGLSLLSIYGQSWLRELAGGDSFFVLNILYYAGLYASLGLMTSKWKETGIAALAVIVLLLANRFAINPQKFDITLRLLFFLLQAVPITIFIALQTGWNNKTIVVYALAMVAVTTLYLGLYADYGLREIMSSIFRYRRMNEMKLLYVILATGSFVTSTVFICEVLNYASGKSSKNKTRLLNLGNEYSKLSGIIVFWSMKTCVWALIATLAHHLYFFTGSMGRYDYGRYFDKPGTNYYILITGLITVLSYVSYGIFLAWYLRKFMLEYFMSFNIRSKFLYWFSMLPIIGFPAFGVAQVDSSKQEGYNDRVNTIGGFESSGTASVTGIFFFLMAVRFLMRIGMGEGIAVVIIPMGISLFLFIWMMTDKNGFYVSIILNLLALTTGIVLMVTSSISREFVIILFPLVLLNLMHLVLLFPVYHFHEFEYIPAEDPDLEKPAGEHLFG
jgi:hypothetical protein